MIKNVSVKDFKLQNGNLIFTSGQGKPGVLFIWADYCSHCHATIPLIRMLEAKLGRSVVFTAIEQGQFKDKPTFRNALNFQYFPTIKFIDSAGNVSTSQFQGERTEDSLTRWISQMSR